MLAVIIVIAIIGLAAWAVWAFLFKKNDDQQQPSDNIVPMSDSTSRPPDSPANKALTDRGNVTPLNSSDSTSFYVIVKETNIKQLAATRLAILKSYNRNVIMYTDDSLIYKVAEPFKLPLSDTTKVLDSLKKYYTGKLSIQIK